MIVSSDRKPNPLPPLRTTDALGIDPPGQGDGPPTGTWTVGELAAEASALIERLPGPLSRVRLALGPVEVEVEWPAPAAPAGYPVAGGYPVPTGYPVPGHPTAAGHPEPATAAAPAGAAEPAAPPAAGTVVEAPLVGVLYRAPSPTEPPFVEVGTRVQAGTQLAIIEAMKLMNPVQSELSGVVTAVLVESGTSVEFGQPLFEIRPEE